MRMGAGLALGFGAGVLALGVFLYSTGRLKVGQTVLVNSSGASVSHALPTPAPPDASMPSAPPTNLPPPPNPALTAAPPAMQAMPVSGELNTSPSTSSSGADSSAAGAIGLPLKDLKRESIQDTFNDTRGGGTKHEASDIMALRGAPVMAVVEGNVVKLFNSKKGGLTVYQYDNAQKFCYYYAHLDKYAEGLKEGMLLRKGDVLGYVGSTGDAQANNPHLHFAILELGPDKHWWEHTKAVNPYPVLVRSLGK